MLYKYWFSLVAIPTCICTTIAKKLYPPKRHIDGANWMADNINILGKRKLKDICIPGSHDSGMSSFSSGTSLAHPCNVLTQSLSIKGQLEYGARYFDVRPAIVRGGQFFTGHYTKLRGGICQGGVGQSMESIVDEINEFIGIHNELVIVKVSHALNSDKCTYFSQHEWEWLLRILDKTSNLYTATDKNVQLHSLTINHFTHNGKKGAVLYIVSETEVKLWHRLGKGFFYESNLNLYDEFSNTYQLIKMMNDQIKKMKEMSRKSFFVLSWTLTQGLANAALCRLRLAMSIRELAVQAHDNLSKIISEISPLAFPNVLYVDDIKNIDVIAVVWAINNKLRLGSTESN